MGSLSELRFVRFSGGRYKNDHHSPATYKTQHKHYTYTTQVCRVIQTAYTNTWRTLNITNTHTNVVGPSSDPNCCVSQQTTYKHTNRHSPVRMTRCTQVQQEFVLHTLIRRNIFGAICVFPKVIYETTSRNRKFHRITKHVRTNGNSGLGSRFTESSTRFPENFLFFFNF